MAKPSPQLERAIKVRDKIADLISEFESDYPGLRLVIYTEAEASGPVTGVGGQAQIEKVWIEVVARDGTFKKTQPVEVSR